MESVPLSIYSIIASGHGSEGNAKDYTPQSHNVPSYWNANMIAKAKTMPKSTIATMRPTTLRSLLVRIATHLRACMGQRLTAIGTSPTLGRVVIDEPVPPIRAKRRHMQRGIALLVGEVEMDRHFLLRTSKRIKASA